MEKYSDIQNDTFDAPDATDATPAIAQGQQHEAQHPTPPVHPIRAENEGNHLAKAGILRARAKRLKTRQESRVTTRAGKSAEAVIKQFASQELRSEKEKMQGWKENFMQGIGREIEIIKQTYAGLMESQRRSFQLELERMGGKAEQLELEVQALKAPG